MLRCRLIQPAGLAYIASRVAKRDGLGHRNDAVAGWLTARGGRLPAADLADPPRWQTLDGAACLTAG